MARRRPKEDHQNHDRWLVSYADFITLLFAFFVVMYSLSPVNESNYRVLSDSVKYAFNSPLSLLNPTQTDQVSQMSSEMLTPLREEFRGLAGNGKAESALDNEEDEFTQQVLNAAEIEVNAMAEQVEEQMGDLIDQNVLDVKRNKFWLEIEIKSSLLFLSGSSVLIPAAVPQLLELSRNFVNTPNRIHIEGFTDDKPISTEVFPSNWELSTARAAAVVRLFESNGIEPSRLAAIGYGQYHPIAENDSEVGRARNRRVVLVVMAALEGREDERSYEFEVLKERSGLQGSS